MPTFFYHICGEQCYSYDFFENRRIKAWLRQILVQEPAKEQDIGQLFTEDTLAPNLVQGEEQKGLKQPLRWNGGPSNLRLHLVELRRERYKRPVD